MICPRTPIFARLQTHDLPQQFSGSTVEVPHFAIAVKLSPKATERHRSLRESVQVLALFDGDPLPGQGKYKPRLFLGNDEKLVDDSGVSIRPYESAAE